MNISKILHRIVLLVCLKTRWILLKSFKRKLIDKICSQNLSSWSVDVDGIFPKRNLLIFVRKTLFASSQFSRAETSWNIILFKKNVCSISQNYIWNIGLLLNESKKVYIAGWMTYESVENRTSQNCQKLETAENCLHQTVENKSSTKAKMSKISFLLWKAFFVRKNNYDLE